MRILTLLVTLGLLVACGERKPPEKTVFDTQKEALNKAREAGDKLRAGAEKTREALEASSPQQSGY
jgi:hypothetical protein